MNRTHEGWHRAMDIQLDTVKWMKEDYGASFYVNFYENLFNKVLERADSDIVNLFHHTISTLYQADTVYVTSDMMHILLQAAHDLPEGLCFEKESLMCTRGFVLFEESISGVDRSGRTVTVHALAWEWTRIAADKQHPEGSEGIALYFLTDPTDFNDEFNERYLQEAINQGVPIPPLLIAHFYPAVIGEPIPEVTERGSEIVVGLLKFFVAMQLVAQQKIGSPQTVQAPRATRRRVEREWPDRVENSGMITLITLRRQNVKSDEPKESIPWTRRWMVRGHWRNQYYPKTKTHAWKYIYEYIKGPEDKPLVLTERRVFNFRR